MHCLGYDRGWRIRSHATGIGPLIPIKNSLMILGGWQREDSLSISKCNKRCLFTNKKLFDNNAVAGITKSLFFHNLIDSLFGLVN